MLNFDLQVIWQELPFLGQGLLTTLLFATLSILVGLVLGTLLALMRLSPFPPFFWLATAYINLFRSIPILLGIFWFYFLVPFIIGRSLGNFASAFIAFVQFEAAYYSEIIRAGIQSVPQGQIGAGLASGLNYPQVMWLIVLPQAFRNMIPPLLTQSIVLFQDTSLISVINVREFMGASRIIAEKEGRPVEIYIFAALIYLLVCLISSQLVKFLEQRTDPKRRRSTETVAVVG
ncbi:MAG: amino acid ABC transporter permease [Cyanobacteriota bacterium]|nr:amino acid ABC transporter permease [Cyanobacteriota bacterium]